MHTLWGILFLDERLYICVLAILCDKVGDYTKIQQSFWSGSGSIESRKKHTTQSTFWKQNKDL